MEADPHADPPSPGDGAAGRVEVRRSERRSRTVTAYRDGERTVVLIPDHFDAQAEREWVERMQARLRDKDRRRFPREDELLARAEDLSQRYLDGRARPTSVAWSERQLHRWGSCSPDDGSIRLSVRLRGRPPWVIDYVILHELAHLLEDRHSQRFWDLLDRYPRTERARGYLEGFESGQRPTSQPGEEITAEADAE
jgi:predicted metal-dependent hydrolase